jgi:hypothetical protein
MRELLILDGTLDASTLKVSGKESRFKINNESISIPRYQRHLVPKSWPRSAELNDTTLEKCRKRKKSQGSRLQKMLKPEDNKCYKVVTKVEEKKKLPSGNLPSAEDITLTIIQRGRSALSNVTRKPELLHSSENISRRPRTVSEADFYPLQQADRDSSNDLHYSQEISGVLDLQTRNVNGTFPRLCVVSSMIHTSITNEAVLRDAAMAMTEGLVESFNDSCLRLFLGYKAPNIRRERLIQLLSGFLFDTSHALFAWEQTEIDILARDPETKSLDFAVQQCLFDDRAKKKVGGLDPCCLLPQALSIARLRRSNTPWESFATTVQGKRMLEHHTREDSVISVGKMRRGQRLRQRHWLSSSLLVQDSDQDAPDLSAPRARSCSLGSSDDEVSGESAREITRQTRILADMPGTIAISLMKQSPNLSWGVSLGKEDNACVVGRAKKEVEGRKGDHCLRCGDLILHGFNEFGHEALTPLCSWSSENAKSEDDWFRAMVDLFKKSKELHLVVQRVVN